MISLISKFKTGILLVSLGVASSGFMYFKGVNTGKQLQKAEQLSTESIIKSAIEESRNLALEETAKAISKIEVKNVTIYRQATKEVIKEPVYRDCTHTPDGLQLVNEALSNGKTANKPSGDTKLP